MKTLLIIASFILSQIIVSAQQAEVSKISAALGSGNSQQISELLLNNIDLTIGSNDDVYSKAQAAQILKSFFEKNPAQKFSIEHEGSSRSNDIYKIGKLITKNGAFRVTFFLKNEGGRFLIKELRIENSGGF